MQDATLRLFIPMHKLPVHRGYTRPAGGVTRLSRPHTEPPAPVGGLSHLSCREARLGSSARCAAWCLFLFQLQRRRSRCVSVWGVKRVVASLAGGLGRGYVSCRCFLSTLCEGASLQCAGACSPNLVENSGLSCSSIYPVFRCSSCRAWVALLKGLGACNTHSQATSAQSGTRHYGAFTKALGTPLKVPSLRRKSPSRSAFPRALGSPWRCPGRNMQPVALSQAYRICILYSLLSLDEPLLAYKHQPAARYSRAVDPIYVYSKCRSRFKGLTGTAPPGSPVTTAGVVGTRGNPRPASDNP